MDPERDDRWMQLAGCYEHAAELAGVDYFVWWHAVERELLRRGVNGPRLWSPRPIELALAARAAWRVLSGVAP